MAHRRRYQDAWTSRRFAVNYQCDWKYLVKNVRHRGWHFRCTLRHNASDGDMWIGSHVSYDERHSFMTHEAELLSAPGWERKWFALGVTPRHEKTVSRLLDQKGYETFLPLYGRRHQYGGRTRKFQLPVFPGYLFCNTDLCSRLPILTTPGVLYFLGAGRVPIPIEESEIAALQKAALAGIAMTPLPLWQAGAKGRISNGPLAGVEGIIMMDAKQDAKKPCRLVLSVTLLQRSVLLEVDADCVVPEPIYDATSSHEGPRELH